MRIYVLGNGESRENFSLSEFDDKITVGCNALHRDYSPTLLVAGDSKITQEIRDNYKGNFLYRDGKQKRFVWETPVGNVVKIEKMPWWKSGFSWYAGVSAVYAAACWEGVTEVWLVGFDSLLAPKEKVNNIYKGTPCYCAPKVRQIAALNVRQSRNSTRDVIRHFPDIEFVFVLPDIPKVPDEEPNVRYSMTI